MAKTGFFDISQGIYLPRDTLTWADLTSGWSAYTTWYQNLSVSTTVEFTGAIIDLGSSKQVVPLVELSIKVDGDSTASPTFVSGKPIITFECSDVADLSSAVTTVTVDKDTNYNATTQFLTVGAKRYYRATFNINSGLNTAPQGFAGMEVVLSKGDANTTGYVVGALPSASMTTDGNIVRDD